jgi:hypothetical protein
MTGSLPFRIGRCRQKCHPGLWPHQTLSRREFPLANRDRFECQRDRFESGEQPTDFDKTREAAA